MKRRVREITRDQHVDADGRQAAPSIRVKIARPLQIAMINQYVLRGVGV